MGRKLICTIKADPWKSYIILQSYIQKESNRQRLIRKDAEETIHTTDQTIGRTFSLNHLARQIIVAVVPRQLPFLRLDDDTRAVGVHDTGPVFLVLKLPVSII